MLQKETIKKNAELYNLLSNPKRLLLLNMLVEQDMSLKTITEELDASKSNISQHLSILKAKGLVDSRRDGVKAVYSLRFPDIVNACKVLSKIQKELR